MQRKLASRCAKGYCRISVPSPVVSLNPNLLGCHGRFTLRPGAAEPNSSTLDIGRMTPEHAGFMSPRVNRAESLEREFVIGENAGPVTVAFPVVAT